MHIFVIYIVLLVLVNSNRTVGEFTVTATISDKSAVASGFGEFVTYQFYHSIHVYCRSDPQHVDGILELFQDDSSLGVEETPTLYQMVDISSIDFEGYSERRIMFTCQFRVNTDHVSYIVENSVSLLVRADMYSVSLCESSLGSSGTEHESSLVVCATSLPANQLMWSGESTLIYSYETSSILSSVEISEGINPMICSRRFQGRWREVCRLPEFEVISEPTVSISPETFSGSEDSVSFTCQSNPPSRIRWAVVGGYGNILDNDFIAKPPDGEWTVHVEDIAGTSTITLAGGAVSFLNIGNVVCITYGRQYTEIGVAHRESISFGSNDSAFIIVITILAVSTVVLAVSCALLFLKYKRNSEPTMTPGSDNLENINPSYEPYRPPEAGAAPYMEVMDVHPSAQNTNLYKEGPVDEDYQLPSL